MLSKCTSLLLNSKPVQQNCLYFFKNISGARFWVSGAGCAVSRCQVPGARVPGVRPQLSGIGC